jgi:ribonucleoside-diphosphate reductase beta chain
MLSFGDVTNNVSATVSDSTSQTVPPAQISAAVTGVEAIDFNARRVTVDEKRVINCRADVNQLVPFKYEWAWQKYLDA